LAVIKNIIQTQFTSTGAAGVTKDVETLNRSQTRLGQSSASAGRAFAAQASGLGGLVAAYAGAAATVFALQQAFAALAKAAQAETIVQGTKTLALEIGQSGPQILKSIQSITQGQLTLAEAAQNANIALSAGFNTRQIEGFTTVALKASKALGRDFTDSLQRITRGVSKLEPELLDELGIFTRLEPAVQAYAKTLGVSASSLSEFQRRQAFANAAIEEGLRKFGAIDTTSASAQKSLERLQVQISELSTAFLQIVANALVPFIDAVTNNAGNAIAAFGLLLTLVFKKAGQEIGGWAEKSIKNISDYAGAVATAAAQSKSSFADIGKSVQTLQAQISARGGLSGGKGIASELSGRFAKKGIERDLATEAAKVRERFLSGATLSTAQIEADRKTLEKIAPLLNQNSLAYKDATAIIGTYTTAMQGAGIRVKALTALQKGLEIGAKGLSLAMRGLAASVNILFTGVAVVQLVGTFFDVDLIKMIKDAYADLTQASKDLKTGILGAVSAAAGGSNELVQAFKDIGASDTYIENLSNEILKVKKQVQDAAEALKALEIPRIPGAFIGFGEELARARTDAELYGMALRKLIKEQDRIIAQGGTEWFFGLFGIPLKDAELFRTVLIQLQREFETFGLEYQKLFGELARSTGLSAENIAKSFNSSTIGLIEQSGEALIVFGQKIEKVNGEFTLENASSQVKDLANAATIAENTITDLREGLTAGGISTTALGSKIEGLNTQLLTAKKALDLQILSLRDSTSVSFEASIATQELQKDIKSLESTISVYQKLFDEITKVEEVTKGISQAFSSDIGRKATAAYEGFFDLQGKIATTQEQQIANQTEFLTAITASTLWAARLQGNSAEIVKKAKEQNLNADQTAALYEKINAEAALFNKTSEAIVGRFINLAIEFAKIADELSKATVEAENLIGQLAFEETTLKIQLEIDTKNIKFQLEEQLRNLQVQQLQADINLIQAQGAAGVKSQLQVLQDVNTKQEQILNLQLRAEEARYQNVKDNLAAEAELNLQNYNKELDLIENRREVAVEEARSRLEGFRIQANQMRFLLSNQSKLYDDFNEKLADVLTQGAAAFVTAIQEKVATTVTAKPTDPLLDFTALDATIMDATRAFLSFEDTQARLAQRQADLAFETYNATTIQLEERSVAEEAIHKANIRRLLTEDQTRQLNHKAELNRINKEAEDKARAQREALAKFLEDFSKTLSQVFDFVNQVVSGIFEGKIIQARQKEEFITSVLTSTSERLTAAQSELSSSLEQEISLREELVQATLELTESQTTYLESLGQQNVDIAEAGKTYVDNLLSQKRTIMELADANRTSIALGKQVSSLEETQAILQEELADATASRVKLENRLAATQEILSLVTQAVTKDIDNLAASLRNLGNAAGGPGGGAPGMGPTEVSIANAGEVFAPVANSLKAAVTEAAAATAGKAALSTTTGEGSKELLAASVMLNTASTIISSAVSGFNIGKSIGIALGSDGVASGIGSAIGNVVGTVFKTQIAGFLASSTIGQAIGGAVTSAFGGAAASALGTVFTAAIPVFGAIIGALIGNLFSSKPRGEATGTLTAEGYETTSQYGKKISGEALAAIPAQALTGVVTALKSAGISFVDTVTTSINYYKKGISGATLEFANGVKESFGGGSAQEAGQFFIDSFFKGVRVERDEAGLVTFRSLVVDALTPNRETIQNAVDRFAELSDAAEKTAERFEEAIQFASSFNETLTKLQGPATSASQAVSLITASAQQNSAVAANYYREFLANTSRTFGEASVEYEAALDAIQANALSQLGLARVTQNGVTQIKSLTEAQSDLNAGFLLVTEIVSRARGSVEMLTAAGFDNIGEIVETSINTQLVDAINTTAQALSKTIEVLKNPAKAAVFELEDILTNSSQRIENLRGVVDGLNASIEEGLQIDPSLISNAQENIRNAAELVDLELDVYIRSLSEAQLKAIISTESFTDAINSLAETQLNYLQVVGAQKATATLIATGRRLSKTLADVTNQFNVFRVGGLLGIGTDIDTLSKNLGQTEVNAFTIELNDALNSIATGVNISGNLSSSIALLNSEFEAGTITSEQYAYGIDQVISTTEEYLDLLTELSKEYKSTISEISGAFKQSKDVVISTIQDLGSQIISLTNNISSKTSDILGIYDDTLASVAESGNELFDLRDTAQDAFETASKAVKEFERSNKLSGKSVETLRGELSSVETELASLVSADNLDFSGFLLLTELSSKQNALKKEINSVVAVESEYQDLLDTRSTALEDLAFVEATLATLDDNLVDTRRKESEIIKKTQDATTSFISSQQELQDITALLAESNFNLNQIRFDEESAVTRVKNALATYNKDLDNLTSTLESIGGESGAALQASFVKAAAGNAEIIFAGLEEAARNTKIEEATAQAAAAFDQLQTLATQVSGFFEPVEQSFTGLETISVGLTDKFQQFSTDIVKYLETEGLEKFYGPGGVFFQFKETLLDTIKNQGFDVLTAPGGPLQNFNTNLLNISTAIETLSNAGNFLDITIQTAETTFGSFITAVGTDLERLTAGYVGLSIVGANLNDTAPDNINLYAEGIGNLNAVLEDGGSLSILLSAAEAMDSLYSSVTIIDSLLNEINFEVSAENAKGNIVSAVEIVNSTIDAVDLSISASSMVDNITTNVDLLNSTISAVDISVSATAMNEAITSAVGTIDSTLTGVDLTTSTAAMVAAIDTSVSTLDTALTSVDLTTSTSEMVAAIDATVETLNSTLIGVDLTTGTESAVAAITTSAETVTSTLSGVDLTSGTESAVAAITTSAETVTSTLSGVDLTPGTDSAVAAITTSADTVINTLLGVDFTDSTSSMVDNITTNVTLLNSTLGEVDLTTSTDVMVQAINTTVTTLNSTLENLSLGTATDSAVGKLSETITAINSTLTNIAFSDAEDVAVGAITNTVEAINSVLDRIDLTDVTNSAVGKIEVSISALQSVLDGIDLVEISESTVNKFNAVVEAIVSTLDTIDLVEVTNSTVSKLKATITAMESTLANIDLIEVTESTVEKFEVAVVAIKSTLENISLVDVTDSTIGEFTALATAIESTLTNIDLTSVTGSTVDKLTTVVSTIDSTLEAIDFVDVTTSTVGKINTLAETTNSTLSAVSFVEATASVVKEINSVNETVNSTLSEVDFVTTLESAVGQINTVNETVNSTLDSVDFVSTLESAVNEISLVNTNINSILSDVNYATSLNSAVEEITLVNTNINSILNDVNYATSLSSTIDEISAVNEDINSALTDVTFVTALDSAVKEINAVTGSLNTSLDKVDFVVTTNAVVEKVNAYNTAVNSALNNVALVTSTESAVGEINAVNTSINSSLDSVDFVSALGGVVDEITALSVDLNSALDNVDFVVTTDAVVEKVSAYNIAVNSALSNIELVDTTDSVVEKIEAVSMAINSALNDVTLVDATNSTIGVIEAMVEAINSTLNDVTLVDATNSTIDAINAAISAIDSTLNDVTLVTSTETVTGAITAVISAINSTLNGVTLVTAKDSAVQEITTAISAVNSTLNDVTLVDASDSVIDKITAAISAINSTLNNVSLVDAKDSVIEEITAVISALNSTLNGVNLVSVTDSAVGKINAVISALDSTLNGINLVTVTNSAVGKINTSISAINTALNDISLVTGTNSAIEEITNYNDEVNAALGNVSLSAKTDAVALEISNLNDINVELGKISYTLNLNSAKDSIIAVNTDINNALKDISASTNLTNAKNAISTINTELNARLATINADTNLTQAKNRIDAINTDLNARLSAINLTTNLTQASNNIASVGTTINSSLSNVNLSNATAVFDALVAVFTQTATDKVTAFKNAIAAFANITTEITNTQNLALEISKLSGDTGSVKTLIDRFVSLQSTINSITGTSGISALQTQINKIATDLQNAWKNLDAKNITVTTTGASTVSLGSTDSGYLRNISDYANKFPALSAVGVSNYTRGTFAEGGYVEGPGGPTTDSIPARLSNGEFVLRASAVSRLDREFLEHLNKTGDLRRSLSMLGRYGDTELAHITPTELRMLIKAGGSGTLNPRTGMLEFFNKDGGAISRLFAKQEADLLWNIYGSKILKGGTTVKSYAGLFANQGNPEVYTTTANSSFGVNASGVSEIIDPIRGTRSDLDISSNALFSTGDRSSLLNSQAAIQLMANEMLFSRKAPILTGLRSSYAQNKFGRTGGSADVSLAGDRQYVDAQTPNSAFQNFTYKTSPMIGPGSPLNINGAQFSWGPSWAANDKGGTHYNAILEGWGARYGSAFLASFNKALGSNIALGTVGAGSTLQKTNIEKAIEAVNNAYPVATDLYMLGNTRGSFPNLSISSPDPKTRINNLIQQEMIRTQNDLTGANWVRMYQTMSSGGPVKGQRDSVSALLEPGEFVLRKAAVEQMGLDAAYKLNATGDVGGDTNVEVNITNNGAPVNVAATPQIRRENGKIVLDIILEDIRNNGPIRQQIRSIR
jgi:hypothetical protein